MEINESTIKNARDAIKSLGGELDVNTHTKLFYAVNEEEERLHNERIDDEKAKNKLLTPSQIAATRTIIQVNQKLTEDQKAEALAVLKEQEQEQYRNPELLKLLPKPLAGKVRKPLLLLETAQQSTQRYMEGFTNNGFTKWCAAAEFGMGIGCDTIGAAFLYNLQFTNSSSSQAMLLAGTAVFFGIGAVANIYGYNMLRSKV